MPVGMLWFSRLLCQLHRHELMWFAHVLREVLKTDGQPGLIDQVSAVEVIVTARFRRASATWVKSAVILLVVTCLVILLNLSVLISSANISPAIFWNALSFICVGLVFVALFGTPLAQVAETLEHDVVHALNRPSVLKSA